jgi:hypothetical protein
MEQPKVTISFDFPSAKCTDSGEVPRTHQITATNAGAPIDVNFVSPGAANSNLSFEYSGRHDHGSLDASLKSDGPLAVLVGSINEAKKACDDFLTNAINVEFGYDNDNDTAKASKDQDEITEEDGGQEKKKLKK